MLNPIKKSQIFLKAGCWNGGIYQNEKRKQKINLYTYIGVFRILGIDVTYRVKLKPNKNDKSYVEEEDLLLSIRGDKSIYLNQYIIVQPINIWWVTKRKQHKKD